MVKRIGNVIGTPVEPTSTSATGTFTITSQQQKNISVTFPKTADRGNVYTDVSILGNMFTSLIAGNYTANGNLIVRYADNREWVDKEDYALFNGIGNNIGSKMLRRDTATNGATLATATICYVTNHTTGQISRYTASTTGDAGITGSYTSDYDGQGARTFRHYVQGASVNTGYLPRQEDPLTFDGGNHKYLKLNLNRFKTTYIDPQNVAGGVSAGGGSTILGAGIHGMYTVQVYPNYNIGPLPDVSIEETLHDPSAPNYSNTADCTNSGPVECDVLLVGGGGAGGRLYNYVGQIGSHQNRPDISSGSGAGGGVLIGYNVPIPRVYGWQTFNITVGQGGDKYGSAQAANGTGSSALGCYVPGGGHGAWGGKLPNVLAAGNGGNGGGSISAASHSAGERLVGLAGLSTISASATTAIGGTYYLYGNDGGFIPGGNFISEGDAPSVGREAYSVNSTYAAIFGTGNVRNRCINNQSNGGGIGGGAAQIGNGDNGNRFGANGVYVSWCTPDLTHLSIKTPHPVSAGTATLPLFEGMPYNQTHKNSNDGTRNVNTDGANGPKQNYQGGYFGGSGSSERDEETGKGGGGIGTRRNGTNWSAETTRTIGIAWPEGSTTTLGVDGLDGMGGGGGAVYADNMNNNSSSPNPMYGGSGGNGIVVLRFPRDRFDTRVSSSGASDIIYVNDYVLVVFRSDSTISVRNDP